MTNRQESIISAGIDIGTSTTKIVISRLKLQNTAGKTHVPKIEIVEKEILYRSPIFKTPLLDEVTIDMKSIEKLVFEQYERSGFSMSQIASGAILITGETATKKNASNVIHHLSDTAGQFLVATAGPDLESILAAKGSGAWNYSKKTSKVVANIDIGGGTTNIAVLKNGEVIGTCTLHVGGRLLEFQRNKVIGIAPSIQRLMENWHNKLHLHGEKKDDIVREVISIMCQSVSAALNGTQDSDSIPLLLGHVPNWSLPIDAIVFSGGVAQCMYPSHQSNCGDGSFDDIGQLLATSLRNYSALQRFEWVEPEETVRATVTGAGTQSTEISGATIQIQSSALPLKNIPVITCDFQKEARRIVEVIETSVQRAKQLFDANEEGELFALYLANLPYLGFRDVDLLAQVIHEAMAKRKQPANPIIIIVQADYAKVIGQTLLSKNEQQEVICIDQIQVETGDYIDIGNMLHSGVVPVVVKTLAFHSA